MTSLASSPDRLDTSFAAAVIVAGGGAATILGAFFFQYVLNYEPCAMCLEQRIPYYIVIPLAALLAIGAMKHAPAGLTAAGLAICALLMLGCSIFAAYHAGVEWKWWAGPAGCTGTAPSFGSAADLFKDVATSHMPMCDAAAVRIFGLSLAGWNALIALALAAVAFVGAKDAWRRASAQRA
jgi:disulfide bond formation protein DsbB